MNRREWLLGGTALLASSAIAKAAKSDPARQQPIEVPLKVQPVLLYETPQRRPSTSWRNWGGIQTEAEANAEAARIGAELDALQKRAGFPIEVLPLRSIKTAAEAAPIAKAPHDVTLLYAAGGPAGAIQALTAKPWTIAFLRHRSGPVSLWYEIMHPRLLRKTVDEYDEPLFDVHDVVVDEYQDVQERLLAFHGLKNSLGKRIVAVGGPAGWGKGGAKAPEISRSLWKLDIRNVTYDELGARIRKAREDSARVRRCTAQAEDYLRAPGTQLETKREFVHNAFLLTDVFRDLLDEAATDAITINNCMGTIMPMSETTACLPLSILNDDGYMAFCESDFVVVPSGILLRYIARKPMFLNDPTYPHHGVVTLAHCTAPRKMDGERPEPVRILTHFESDYGAAPKVEMAKGAKLTNIIPDFNARKFVVFEGEVVDNPFLPICRSQIDVAIKGDTETVLREMKGFHWMTSYGSHVNEVKYALRKLGIEPIVPART